MKTQAQKLELVLANGSISKLSLEETLNVYSDVKNIQGEIIQGKHAYCFTPYSEDNEIEKTVQLVENPFTLITYIYKQLISL